MFLFSCEDIFQEDKRASMITEEQIDHTNTKELFDEQKNLVVDELAKVVSISMEDVNVRRMLHKEISKQFDFDYDILYSFVKDKVILTEGYGEITYQELLIKIGEDNNISISNFKQYSNSFPNLQISSPIEFDSWDAEDEILQVISLPVHYDENSNTAVSSYSGTQKRSVYEKSIKEPIILIRQSERVSSEGMMRIDPRGIILPKYLQVLSAEKAYELASNGLKSSFVGEPLVEVVRDKDFETYKRQRIKELDSKFRRDPGSDIIENNAKDLNIPLKSVNTTSLSTPTILAVYPYGQYQIKIDWLGVTGAVSYEIYRHSDISLTNMLLATVSNTESSFVDTYDMWVTNRHYFYSIRAIDENGEATALTAPYEAVRSWRTKGARDRIHKIFIDEECWSWCCGGFDGKIELEYKTAYWDKNFGGVTMYPLTGTTPFGQQAPSEQYDKWCIYNDYLFPWDPRVMSYNYRFRMIEDDSDGEGATVNFGLNYSVVIAEGIELKVSPVSVAFKIADRDEEFGELLVNYGERFGEKNIPCHRGNAKIYIAQ